MNQKNLDALAAILAEVFAQTQRAFPAMQFTALDSSTLAEALASRGVLAVDALTDEEAEWFDTTDRVGGDDRARVVRQKLAQIAKGEDPSDYTPFQP